MLRFSLLSLFLAVSLVAVGCAALVYASPLWARLVVTATFAALLAASVGAFYLPDKSRVFAGGFAICGWGYLLLSQQPWLENMKPDLLTTAALNRLEPLLEQSNQAEADAKSTRVVLIQDVLRRTYRPLGVSASFDRIGHSLWAILLGCIGGGLASVFDSRRRKGKTL